MDDINTPELISYIENHTTSEIPLLRKLSRETYLKVPQATMLSGHVQGQLLNLISKIVSPKIILEIGTYTGYSAICLAQGLQSQGQLITIDINEELKEIVDSYVAQAGLQNKIIQHIGDALEIIPTLNTTFDIVFIDADKENYSNYYDLVFDKVCKGGIILADNLLWSLKVMNSKIKDKQTKGLREFNEKIQKDKRVENIILPIRDGIGLIRKL